MLRFILGIIFAIVILPILDGLTGVILSWFELLKTYFGVRITKLGQSIHEPEVKCQIGFSAKEEEQNDI